MQILLLQNLRDQGTGETNFFIIQEIFFVFFFQYIQIYIQKVAQNHLDSSNFRDFISCTGQNTCKKGIFN